QINEELTADGFKALTVETLGGSGFVLNPGMGDTKDPNVREALSLATGSELIVGNLYPGAAVPKKLVADSYGLDITSTFPGEDLKKAQKLIDAYLKESGKSEVEVV